MASLFNTRISDTYPGLIKSIDNAALTASLKELTDGSGNATGVFMNNAGDFKVTAILEFGSLKDTGENITISKFVDAADGIGNNDNDTTIPTTAAIIDYVAAQITIEDLDFTGDTGSGQIDLDSQIFAIGGTTNEITTVASGQSITFSLDSTGVNLPDNSTAITQTAGDNSTKIATTSYVDTLDAASDLDFSGDSGTGDVNLNTQTFAITGTTNQITTSASGQGLSLSLPATVHRNLQGNVTGNITGDLTGNITSTSVLADGVTATTQASSDDSTKVATTAYVKGLNNASDLDFTTDSGSGAVVLNSQTFSVLGTTNEIETSGSGQAITIGLPSTVNVNVTGNLTGNVTGNVTGNITGDVTGDVTGNLTGNSTGTHTGGVIGNVTGNVTGDLTGNADTATKWQTARDLSLTGQATGTISSVDGSGNVSGAVTLDNNSVTSKVLTGLPTPSSSSVLATDTILEGFGKLQSQLNGIANGLQFQGSWDADTNSPVLSSGGGEATNGTTTATTANKLVDSSASFTSTVTVGDKVVNQVDGQSALVTNIDSDTTLSIDADIMLNNEAYTIDNSPFITQGHYYVVSVGGTTTLNGVSNWAIGDWVIAGANNQWTKLDHSQVDGTGTPGNLTKWSATQVIADSIVSESGTAITVDGSLNTNTNLSSTGDFAVNTDKFTVAAASGNTAFAGDLAINTNKFTVNATSGNTVVGGDVTVNGGDLNVNSSSLYSIINLNSSNDSYIEKDTGTSLFIVNNVSDQDIKFRVNDNGSNVTALTLSGANNGNATFAGSVDVNGSEITVGTNNSRFAENNLRFKAGSDAYIDQNTVGQSFRFRTSNSSSLDTEALIIASSGNATFAGNVTTGASLISTNAIVDNITAKTTNGNLTFKNNGGSTIAQFANNLNATFAGDVIQSGTSKSLKYFRRLWTDANNDWGLNNNAGTSVISVSGMGTPSTSTTTFTGNVGVAGKTPAYGLNLAQGTGAGNKIAWTDVTPHFAASIYASSSTDKLTFATKNASNVETTALEIDTLQNATFAGNVNINGTTGTPSISVVNSSSGGNNQIFQRWQYVPNNTNFRLDLTQRESIGLVKYAFDLINNGTAYNSNLVLDRGNVGIGTDSPSAKLHAVVTTAGDSALKLQDDTGSVFDFQCGIAGVTGDALLIKDTTSNYDYLTLRSGNIEQGTVGTTSSAYYYFNATTTGDTGIIFRDNASTNSGFLTYNHDQDAMKFATGGSERMRIDSSGNIGIGQSPYSYSRLSTEGSDNTSSNYAFIAYNENTDAILACRNDGQVTMPTGNVGIGTTTNINAPLTVQATGGANAINIIGRDNGTADESIIDFYQNDGTTRMAYMLADDGNLDFATGGSTVRMRITSGGDVLMGDFASNGSIDPAQNGFGFQSDGKGTASCNFSDTNEMFVFNQRDGAGTTQIDFRNGNVERGKIQWTTSGTTYNTTSDYRVKENLKDFNGLNKVSKIKVYDFNWIESKKQDYGVIAHELQEILPLAVTGEKDAEKMQSVDYSKIVPLLVKSIQELKAEVDKLKQECKCKN